MVTPGRLNFWRSARRSARRGLWVLVWILSWTGLSAAEWSARPVDQRQMAERGMLVFRELMALSREDPAVSSVAFDRLASRAWAYQSLVHILDDRPVKKLEPPPSPEGWRQLISLLIQAGQFSPGLEVLQLTKSVFEETDLLLLDVIFRLGLDEGVERPASKLLLHLQQNPLLARRLIQRWWLVGHPPFAEADFDLSLRWDRLDSGDTLKEIYQMLSAALRETQGQRESYPDTWTLMMKEAAPGQEIWFSGRGPVQPNAKRIEFIQNGKSTIVAAGRTHGSRKENGYVGTAVVGVPDKLSPGPAKIMIPKAGLFELTIVSRPAPARIQEVSPNPAMADDWIHIQSVGLQAKKNEWMPVSEREKSGVKEWTLAAIFSQAGQEWSVEQSVQTWRGFMIGDQLFRIPATLAVGQAQVKLKLQESVSEPYAFYVSMWPNLESLTRDNTDVRLVAMPGAPMTILFNRAADAFAAIVRHPSGRYRVWRPESAVTGQRYAETRWRVPADWEIGIHDLIWAARISGLWSVPGLDGETLTVSPFAAALEKIDATYLPKVEEGTITTFGKNGYETVKYRKGDVIIQGQGIETGETYDLSIRFSSGNTYSVREVSAYDWLIIVNVNPSGPIPDQLEIRRVINGVAGMPASIPIQMYGGVMGDRFTAQTKEGQAAADWLNEVKTKFRAARYLDPPEEKQVLSTLFLDTFPPSPWGGPWGYVRTPAHSSLTFLAHDYRGILKAQFYSGGIGAGLVEYDLLTRGETFGICMDNLYWTYPWATNGLGNFVTDALRAITRADVAVHNTLGLRGNLPAGPVSSRLIQHILPFDNDLSILHMKGADFLEFLREAYASDKYLYVSGMSVEIDSGPKKLDLRIKMGFGKPFSEDAVYRVAMPSYLAEKRAGYPKTSKAVRHEEEGKVREAVEEYILQKSPIATDRIPRVIERVIR